MHYKGNVAASLSLFSVGSHGELRLPWCLKNLGQMNCLILCLPLTYVVKSLRTSLSRQWNEEKLESKQSIIFIHVLYTIGRRPNLFVTLTKILDIIIAIQNRCVNLMARHAGIMYIGTQWLPKIKRDQTGMLVFLTLKCECSISSIINCHIYSKNLYIFSVKHG